MWIHTAIHGTKEDQKPFKRGFLKSFASTVTGGRLLTNVPVFDELAAAGDSLGELWTEGGIGAAKQVWHEYSENSVLGSGVKAAMVCRNDREEAQRVGRNCGLAAARAVTEVAATSATAAVTVLTGGLGLAIAVPAGFAVGAAGGAVSGTVNQAAQPNYDGNPQTLDGAAIFGGALLGGAGGAVAGAVAAAGAAGAGGAVAGGKGQGAGAGGSASAGGVPVDGGAGAGGIGAGGGAAAGGLGTAGGVGAGGAGAVGGVFGGGVGAGAVVGATAPIAAVAGQPGFVGIPEPRRRADGNTDPDSQSQREIPDAVVASQTPAQEVPTTVDMLTGGMMYLLSVQIACLVGMLQYFVHRIDQGIDWIHHGVCLFVAEVIQQMVDTLCPRRRGWLFRQINRYLTDTLLAVSLQNFRDKVRGPWRCSIEKAAAVWHLSLLFCLLSFLL
uniref:Uncharacterized protein n=1 Tax=Chromera velia CCMP2878 TaxID=1169474 RepID=A0A0G4HM65_9ALVE|eukprot:Cvel_1157.t1-p1 / transcript=Cvel_1157.t1 / gene=Cvel_1157 / organism=Chromera_velia_CCMP2878 / gene_product=hypothetical protein / transcript_product=hypothetical protein / location=Cvel_scaffold38:89328-90647(-) / protein_length=440 / sequence_SO=supercontig / SO=protein_coding / is_pseudo=false